MRARVLAAVLLCALVAGAPPAGARSVQLKRFQTCTSLIRFGNAHAPTVVRQPAPTPAAPTPVSMEGGDSGSSAPAPAAAPVAAEDYSTTNVQEAGVDEPDVIKTDGKTVFALTGGTLRAIDVTGEAPKLLDALALGPGYGHTLLIDGDRALVAWQDSGQVEPVAAPAQVAPAPAVAPYYGSRPTEVLGLVDIGDPAHLKLLRTLTIDGTLIDSRLTGGTARVVVGTTPRAIAEDNSTSSPPTAAAARVSRRHAAAWLPAGTFVNKRTQRSRRHAIVLCRGVRRPQQFSGLDMITILTIDLAKGLDPVDSDALMTSGDTVYASQKSLYVASQRYVQALWNETSGAVPPTITTQIHKFDIAEPDRTRYVGSGSVPGFLLSQFALSERDGVLRVASTGAPAWFSDTTPVQNASYVTTLEQAGGALVQLGQVDGIGKGERIYAVRFFGDAGYVVTFRQIDPLFTIDLSKPAAPRVAGELTLLGYSAYLHPIGDGLLIGVGQDASEQGRTQGSKISLFDVSDLEHPALVQSAFVGSGSNSSAEYDHHAFLWWPKSDLAVFPISIYGEQFAPGPAAGPSEPQPATTPSQPFNGAIAFTVKRAGIAEAGRVSHAGSGGYAPTIARSVVIGERLFTLSDAGLKASRLDTLADLSWLPFT